MFGSVSLAALSALLVATTALPTISRKGTKFYTSDGDQWFVKGVAYQLVQGSGLLDPDVCRNDAQLMQRVGANAIRVYQTGPGDHSECMSIFSDAGIYAFVDMENYETGIKSENPYWNRTMMSGYEYVMDEFQKYDNTAGFMIGNEVINQAVYSGAAVYIKAAIRDMKAYSASKGYRKIPIGYAHADIPDLRPNLQNYLACGDQDTAIDFFGLNAYEWCGPNTFNGSGYALLTELIHDYSIPYVMTETGCNVAPPRDFQDQTAIFGPDMTPYWSGSIIYEWIQEANNYGLVDYNTPGVATPRSPDYGNLQSVWAQVNPSSTARDSYTPSNSPPACPPYTAGLWEISGNAPLPTLGAGPPIMAPVVTTTSFRTSSMSSTTSSTLTSTTSSTSTSSSTSSTTPPTSTPTNDDNAGSRRFDGYLLHISSGQGVFGTFGALAGLLLMVIFWL